MDRTLKQERIQQHASYRLHIHNNAKIDSNKCLYSIHNEDNDHKYRYNTSYWIRNDSKRIEDWLVSIALLLLSILLCFLCDRILDSTIIAHQNTNLLLVAYKQLCYSSKTGRFALSNRVFADRHNNNHHIANQLQIDIQTLLKSSEI